MESCCRVADVILADADGECLATLRRFRTLSTRTAILFVPRSGAGPARRPRRSCPVSLVAASSDSRCGAFGFRSGSCRPPAARRKSGEVISASPGHRTATAAVPVPDQRLDLRARSAVIQSRLAGATSSRSRAASACPGLPTRTTQPMPNRSLTLVTCAATVVGIPVLPWNTSIATGMPSLLVSSP